MGLSMVEPSISNSDLLHDSALLLLSEDQPKTLESTPLGMQPLGLIFLHDVGTPRCTLPNGAFGQMAVLPRLRGAMILKFISSSSCGLRGS